MPTPTPPLDQLIVAATRLRDRISEYAAAHKAVVEPMQEQLEGFELLILDAMPEGVDTVRVPYDGGSIVVSRKVKSQYRIEEGRSDDFYAWVEANNRVDLLTRAIKQAAIEAELKQTGGSLPPGMYVHTEVALGMTKRRAAPKAD